MEQQKLKDEEARKIREDARRLKEEELRMKMLERQRAREEKIKIKEEQIKLFGYKTLNKILKYCSIFYGCRVSYGDVSFCLAKTKGENSNSYWHSDSFQPTIKGFLCLTDITKN